jgi:FkbM family methyltransferase
MIAQLPGFKMIVETDIEKYRADTFLTKEPETLAWIDDMLTGEVLYDVGANVGLYSLYAVSRGIMVVAFEPLLENYMRLVQNIELNNFTNILPIYAAIGRNVRRPRSQYPLFQMGPLTINNKTSGSSGAQAGNPSGLCSNRLVPFLTFADMFEAFDKPHHIKIDVDGIEDKILDGLPYNPTYSMLIEINPPFTIEAATIMVDNNRQKYTTDNKYNKMSPHSRERRQKEGIDAENVVFTRK